MKKVVYIVLIATFIFLCVGFVSFNSGQIVTVKFIGFRLENEFWVFLIMSLIIGVLIGYMLAIKSLMQHRVSTRNLNKKLRKIEKELSNLRNLPIKEDM